MFQRSAPSRPSRYSGRPVSLPTAELAMATTSKKAEKAPAPKEIMLWPTILKDSRFDADRAGVEAFFRRSYSDGRPLSAADYQGIIDSVSKMKVSLKSLEPQMVDSEYAAVDNYLDSLIEDAQKRIRARENPQ